MKPLSISVNFVGARAGATGTLDDLRTSPPVPKSWVKPDLVNTVLERLRSNQANHSRLDLYAILHSHLFDSIKGRFRVVWSKGMITAAGVGILRDKSPNREFVLHVRDGEEERGALERWQRRILEGLYAKGGRARTAVEDVFTLLLVHEAGEIHERKQAETLEPNIKAEIRAEIETARAYFDLPLARRKGLKQVYEMLDDTAESRKKLYSRELGLFEAIGEENLGTIDGLLQFIEFMVGMPDYTKEANHYHDERTRLQLARSLFVDILHDFAGSNRVDRWVRDVEKSGVFAGEAVVYAYTEHSAELSQKAEPTLQAAARILATLEPDNSDADSLPGRSLRKRTIEDFNRKIAELDGLKAQLKFNEVLSIPSELRAVIEDPERNRHFSYMDEVGIYHSLNLSRLDLRGLDLHSGDDERTPSDKSREANAHKDRRTDLRGAHIAGSDLSGRANFSSAKLDFVLAPFSNLSEIVFTRARAIGMVLYGANANEAEFEHANLTAVDARGMSASFARVQMKETEINGMKVWQSDLPGWQRAYVDISPSNEAGQKPVARADDGARDSLKAELDFLDDSFLDELDAMEESDSILGEENWIELREVDGQLDFLKGRGIVFYSRDEVLEYSITPQAIAS